MLWLIFAAYMIASVISIEYSWAKMKRLREENEELNAQYPAFRRTDVRLWKKWKFYPIGITAIFRFFLCNIIMFSGSFVSWCFRFGHDDEEPLVGWRKWII